MIRVALGSVAAVCLSLAVVGCASHKGGTTTTDPNGPGATGGDGSHPSAAPGQVVQTGIIIDYDTKKPVAGATIMAAGQTITTDATGAYSFPVDKGAPFTMSVTKDGYAKLIEQETTLEANFDKGKTSFIGSLTANMLLGTLDGYDATLGVLSVQLIPTGACQTEDGATLTVSPAGSAKVKYFFKGIPTSRKSAVVGGEFPSAVIYNVQPGVPLQVGVTDDKCKEAAFPFTKDGVSYTGGVMAEPGQSTSFARVFLE